MSETLSGIGWTTATLADFVGGTLRGNAALPIRGIGRIEDASPDQATFFADQRYAKFLSATAAGCILVAPAHADMVPADKTAIIVDEPYRAFVKVMRAVFPTMRMQPGLRHASASIDTTASIDDTASVGPGCVIGARCRIGANVQLFANVVVYDDVLIGDDTAIHANVTLAAGTSVGQRCIIHAGAVVGSDGFGYIERPDGSFEKIPQVGTVVVGNDVEIGANTTIDRAAVGTTSIADGVKLDNLVHIAHGVSVGPNTAIAAQAGISGSARIGARNRIAGQVGMIGHIAIADDVIIHAQSGVSKAITTPGHYFGSPAKEHRTTLRIEAALRNLPDLLRDFQELQRKVETMAKNLDGDADH
ncbi:MAG: UDP-3-O-(3-hydroxymyristoyl)glucosamine N-acyltransferase [Candidatus Kapabacteria bacterium]|nr:UDP-3-O-(3-hydroxymyristoyl)glucosamine N-acyltransferase [Candidatus Kapabacteria bacterium]